LVPRRLTDRGGGRISAALAALILLASCGAPPKKPAPTPYEVTLAAAAMEGQDYGEAVRLWTNALALPDLTDDQRARALWGRGVAFVKVDNFDMAMTDANAALKLKPDWPELFQLRGGLYLHQRDFTHALDDFDGAIRLKADSPEAHAARADAYLAQGRDDAAMADLDLAIGFKPYVGGFYVTRGLVHLDAGKTTEAAADFDEAVRRAPKEPWSYNARWLTDYRLDRQAQGISDLQTSLALRPEQPYPVLSLHLARLLAKTPDQPEFLTNAAKLDLSKWPGPIVSYCQGKIRAADVFVAATSAEATDRRGQTCEANYYVGQYLIAIHKTDEGRRLLLAARQSCTADMTEYHLVRSALEK
jgi:lipoprotein NlpI